MEKKYDITIYAPLGVRYGTMVFNIIDSELAGTINAFGNTDSFTGKINSGGEVEIVGNIKSLMNSFSFNAKGVVSDCKLSLQLFTNKYSFIITGVAHREGD